MKKIYLSLFALLAFIFLTAQTCRYDESVELGTVLYIGSISGVQDKYVYALDANDGSELWSFETGDHADSSPFIYTLE